VIRIGAFTRREDGWGRQSRSLAAALGDYEPTELLDWEDPEPAPRPFWRRWQPSWRRSVGISLGAAERTFALGARYRVAYHVGETTRIRPTARYFLERADMVWTPSQWGRAVLVSNGVPAARIRVVPEGVDASVFVPPPSGRPCGPVFRFLCVGKWEERKGTADLVRVFRDEFRPGEPVELVMHCGPAEGTAAAVRSALGGDSPDRPPRIACTEPATLEGLVALMQSCHAFVLPTRGEGWGLPILEAMACELPCIVTGYSGLTEFAHDGNAFLVRVAGTVPVCDPAYYDPAVDWGEWARPDSDHLRALMRFVYEKRMIAQARAKRARDEAGRLWNWANAASQAISCIRELRGGRAR
jgi:glycosyltransferase involved in cell wall biosynthesis